MLSLTWPNIFSFWTSLTNSPFFYFCDVGYWGIERFPPFTFHKEKLLSCHRFHLSSPFNMFAIVYLHIIILLWYFNSTPLRDFVFTLLLFTKYFFFRPTSHSSDTCGLTLAILYRILLLLGYILLFWLSTSTISIYFYFRFSPISSHLKFCSLFKFLQDWSSVCVCIHSFFGCVSRSYKINII